MTKRDNYHIRDFPSVPYHEHELPTEFLRFMDEDVLPKIKLTGYKIKEKTEITTHAIHNLITTRLVGKAVGDSRRKDRLGVRLRVSVWDAIIKAGLAQVCLGSEESGKRTRYHATGKLLELREEWEHRLLYCLDLVRNTERPDDPKPLALVLLHTGKVDPATGKLLPEDQKKKPVSFLSTINSNAQPDADGDADPRAIQNGLDYWRAIEDRIERINRNNLGHSWQAFTTDPETGREYVFQPNPCVRQIHVGVFHRAVRLYSWSELSGQNLPQATRRTMLIDGEAIAELDFAGMATRMLYHRKRIDPEGDVYRPELVMPTFYGFDNATAAKRNVVRDFVKRATNVCWNVMSRPAAHSATGKLLAEHGDRDFLQKVIYKVEKIKPSDIVDRIEAAHPDLADRFFTGCGIDLMTTDGHIMLHILEAFSKAEKPALGIHDSIVCRVSDVAFTRETMTEMYYKFLQFDPVIKQVY